MAKKEIIKVPFDRTRFELAMDYMGYSIKTLSLYCDVSMTTIRRALKNGKINREHAIKIATQLCSTLQFLSGDKEMQPVADAFAVVNAFANGAPEMLNAEKNSPVESGS